MNDHQSHLVKYVPPKCEKCGCEILNLNSMCVPCAIVAALKYTHPAQPVQRAVEQGEAVDLRELFERLLFGTYAGKDSYYNDEQIKHGCFERAQELVDVAKRMNIALYTEPPAVAVNEQLLEALKLADAALEGAHMNADVVYKKVKAAIAEAEKAKGGV